MTHYQKGFSFLSDNMAKHVSFEEQITEFIYKQVSESIDDYLDGVRHQMEVRRRQIKLRRQQMLKLRFSIRRIHLHVVDTIKQQRAHTQSPSMAHEENDDIVFCL
jgi:hypothetical protein